MAYVLGLDLGTSSLKGLLMNSTSAQIREPLHLHAVCRAVISRRQ